MGPKTQNLTITENDDGKRIDRILREHLHIPQSIVQKNMRSGKVYVNDKRIKDPAFRLGLGDIVTLKFHVDASQKPAAAKQKAYVPSKHELKDLQNAIVFEDEHILIINKPAGLAVQGGSSTKKHLDALIQYFKNEESNEPLRLTHRLDKETSGLLIFAKTLKAARHFTKMFEEKTIQKTYIALLNGTLPELKGEIDLTIAKVAQKGHEKMRVVDNGLKALTHYEVLETRDPLTLVALTPLTGRTHQLRVHTNALGCPIVGDHKYGGKKADLIHNKTKRLFLHAAELSFIHITGKDLKIKAPLDAELLDLLKKCGF